MENCHHLRDWTTLVWHTRLPVQNRREDGWSDEPVWTLVGRPPSNIAGAPTEPQWLYTGPSTQVNYKRIGDVIINVIKRRVRVTIVAVVKQ